MKTNPLNTISAVVYQCCTDIGDAGNSRYSQFLGWALWSYRELNFDVSGQVERRVLSMDDSRKVNLPLQYVDWTKIAFKGHEIIYTLINVDGAFIWGQIGIPTRLAPSQLIEIDTKAGIMSFSSLVSKQDIVLEYITDGLCGEGETLINPQLAEYLRRCVHYQRADFDGKTESEIARRGRDKFDAEVVVRARILGMTEEELIAALR